MNADIKGMYDYHIKGRRPCNVLESDSGKRVPSTLAKAYIKYCHKKGYKYLHECPDIESVMNELKY
jgi:hypothetical protein